jgi:hypothetical protein
LRILNKIACPCWENAEGTAWVGGERQEDCEEKGEIRCGEGVDLGMGWDIMEFSELSRFKLVDERLYYEYSSKTDGTTL